MLLQIEEKHQRVNLRKNYYKQKYFKKNVCFMKKISSASR